jgi:hypothetical protein
MSTVSCTEVLRVWRRFFEKLGNADDDAARADSPFDEGFSRSLEAQLRKLLTEHRVQPALDHMFTRKELDDAIDALPTAKAAGPDGLPNEFFKA